MKLNIKVKENYLEDEALALKNWDWISRQNEVSAPTYTNNQGFFMGIIYMSLLEVR